MGIDEDYEAWAKETLTAMDREITRELIGDRAEEKTRCPNCHRPEVHNQCACGKWSIYCYSCHLRTDHAFTPETPD